MAAPSQFQKLRDPSQPQQTRTQDNVSATLTPIATALNQTPIMGAAPPAWVKLDLLGGYVTMGSAGVTPDPEFHIDALRYVHFRGRARNPTGGALTAINMVRLPAGARPNVTIGFSTIYSLAGAVANLLITPDGYVQPDAVAAGENIRWYFSFLAEL